MIAAIDVDGTLSVYPVLAALSHALKAAGWTVYVVTGFSQASPITPADLARQQANREAQCDNLGVARDLIHVVGGRDSLSCSRQKAAFCAEKGVELFIDDADRYCADVKARCPSCCVLHVREKARG